MITSAENEIILVLEVDYWIMIFKTINKWKFQLCLYVRGSLQVKQYSGKN